MNQDKTIMNQEKTIILACSSLTEYVEAAQASVGTKMRVRYLNRIYHRDPAEMQEHIKAELERMPEGIDTVLVCMGFCGGSWNQVQSRYRLVIPRVDDCVSLLLQTKDDPVSNLKTPGHLYVRAMDPSTESFKAIFEVKKDADWLGAKMEYVEAGIHLLEKLFSGRWDDQFLVLEPGRAVLKEEMLV